MYCFLDRKYSVCMKNIWPAIIHIVYFSFMYHFVCFFFCIRVSLPSKTWEAMKSEIVISSVRYICFFRFSAGAAHTQTYLHWQTIHDLSTWTHFIISMINWRNKKTIFGLQNFEFLCRHSFSFSLLLKSNMPDDKPLNWICFVAVCIARRHCICAKVEKSHRKLSCWWISRKLNAWCWMIANAKYVHEIELLAKLNCGWLGDTVQQCRIILEAVMSQMHRRALGPGSEQWPAMCDFLFGIRIWCSRSIRLPNSEII